MFMPTTATTTAAAAHASGTRSARAVSAGIRPPGASDPIIPPWAKAPCSRLTAPSVLARSTSSAWTSTCTPSALASGARRDASLPYAWMRLMPSCRTASASVAGTSSPRSNANPSCRPERTMPRPRSTRTDKHAGRRRRHRVDLAVGGPHAVAGLDQRIERPREQSAIDDRDRHRRLLRRRPCCRCRAAARNAKWQSAGIGEQALLEHVRQRQPQLSFRQLRRTRSS